MVGATVSPRRRLALLIVAGAHLGLVAMGGVKIYPHGKGWSSRAIAAYAELSGADSYYTFFSPGVDEQYRVSFEVTDRSGGVVADVLKRGENTEVDLRRANLISLLWFEDEDLRRELLTSWATMVFHRHPRAERVAVRVDAYEVPSMTEHREGRRLASHLFRRATFSAQEVLGSSKEVFR